MNTTHPLIRGWSLALGIAAAVVAMLACAPFAGHAPDEAGDTPPITGRAYLNPADKLSPYTVQASITEVASASTIVLIDTVANITRGSTLTDAVGKFTLSFGRTFKPTVNRTYYLEAVRGLGDNGAGKSAARVRTILAYTSQGWTSITSTASNVPVVIDEGTTALSALANLKGPARVNPMHLIGALALPFNGVTGLSLSDYNVARGIVTSLLKADNDPVAGIAYDPGPPSERIYMRSTGGGSVLSIEPATASITPPDNTVTLRGILFDTAGAASDADSATLTARNVILFNNVATATVTGVSADHQSLYAVVPPEAESGPITVKVNGQLYGIPDYAIWGTLNVDIH
ncbi:MAG TPA: hypothetical protein V6D00_09545 [Pantanalinema sp.]